MEKLIKKIFSPISLVIILGSIIHLCFFSVNEILKNADSFAYLQMSYNLENLSIKGFGTGWFGFVYSLLIAIFNKLIIGVNEYNSSLFLNIILLGIGSFILYKISNKLLKKTYSLFVVILFYLSSSFLSFNIQILSENIYIVVFLGLILFLTEVKSNVSKIKNLFFISSFLALLYLIRAEAFIYILSIFLIIFYYEIQLEKFKFKNIFLNLVKSGSFVLIFFLILISPYLIYLNSITGEWGLTNKGSSNLRQAQLRGSEKMDDSGFEKAVGELTKDKHNLISGFVGGLNYSKGEKGSSIKNFLMKDPKNTINRIINNQIKLYTKNIPEIIIGDSVKLFNSNDSRFYKNYLFLIFIFTPIFICIYGFYSLFKDRNYNFLITKISFFLISSIFFTIFFVLNRYFIIFLPLFLITLVYGIQSLKNKNLRIFFIVIIFLIYCLSLLTFYNSKKDEDYKYEVKKVAGLWLKSNINNGDLKDIKIMERFPIVTYYSGSKQRWLTPYTNTINDIIEYAKFNNIDYFVVDSLDFKEYRKELIKLLDDEFKNKSLIKIRIFQVNKEKVILYKFLN